VKTKSVKTVRAKTVRAKRMVGRHSSATRRKRAIGASSGVRKFGLDLAVICSDLHPTSR